MGNLKKNLKYKNIEELEYNTFLFIENKCMDGRIRNFILDNKESKCLECGKSFEEKEIEVLKERFKNHMCRWMGWYEEYNFNKY